MHKDVNISRSTAHFIDLFRLIKPFHKSIAKGMLAGPLIGILSMVPPYLAKLLFDRVAETYDMTLMLVLVSGIVAFSLTSAISEAALHYYSSYLNIKLENTTQLLFFNHVQHLPLSFFYHRKVGEIASRFQEIKAALGSIHAFISVIFGQGFYMLIVPPFLFLLNWKLAIVAIITIPFSAVAIYWLSDRLRTSWKNVVESHAEIDALQVEMLNQISTVKVMQLERPFYEKASLQLTNLLGEHMRAQSLSVMFMIFDRCISVINIGIFTWLGWYFIIQGEMSIGDYVAFSAYIGYLRQPMKEFVNLFSKFQQWAVHLNRIFEYLNYPTEQDPTQVSEPNDETKQTFFKKRITLTNVSFDYGGTTTALKQITMEIKAGDVVALIGSSGSGKSTILRLLTLIEKGFEGEILIDGTPIQTIPMRQLRSQMSVVWQDVELFQGTLYENLTIGAETVAKEWVEYIVELCCLTEMIAALPEGYDTVITARGITLSGGQRQRIALARALVRRSPVLILDEAMSSLDVETEAEIASNLFSHARHHGQTVIFVTHRVSMAQLADDIYLFDKGKIISSGHHDNLMSNSTVYQKLHRLNKDISSHD